MKSWHILKKRNRYIRNSIKLINKVPRLIKRYTVSGSFSYSLIANSVPKSGTNLLNQVLEVFPRITNYGTFILTTPPLRYRQRSEKSLLAGLDAVAPYEVVSAHLYYNPVYLQKLRQRRCIMYFIYRDPRDVAVSEAHFLTYMHVWHRAHRYFKRLENDHERIQTAVTGIPPGRTKFHYPNIRERFAPFLPWLKCPEVYAVRFEDLVGEKNVKILTGMIDFFSEKSGVQVNRDELLNKIKRNINPARSKTFRKGKALTWREEMSAGHRAAVKSIAGDLLIELGYEKDLDW